jgi:mannose-1-phosphate guanylyltransferase/phosphomannomutase
MLAVVLAAGRGSRMAPLSAEVPKALVPTLDTPQLDWVLASLRRAGVDRAVVNAHADVEAVRRHVAQQAADGLGVDVSYEPELPLGTAGALRHLADRLTEAFLVANADIATDLPLERLLQAHASAKSAATALAIPVEDDADFALEQSWVFDLIDRREEVRSGHRYGGAAIFEPDVLSYIPEGESGLYETVFKGLIHDHKGFAALEWDGYWLDIGTPRDHLKANLDVLAGMRDPAIVADSVRGTVGDAVERWDVLGYVGGGATVDDVDLRHSVVGRGASVAPGSRLERCIVWAGAHLPRGDYRDTIVTPGRQLPVR